MRTTIDLPSEIHQLIRQLAHEQSRTQSEIVTKLILKALGAPSNKKISISESGMPVVSIGRHITAEDVKTLEDEL